MQSRLVDLYGGRFAGAPVHDLGEGQLRLGAPVAALDRGDKPVEHARRALEIAGEQEILGEHETALFAGRVLAGRQPDRELGELRSGLGRTTCACPLCRLLERERRTLVRTIGRECEVACALLQVFDDRRKLAMGRGSVPGGSRPIHSRREKRVRELDVAVVGHGDETRGFGGRKRRDVDKPRGGAGERRRAKQRIARRPRKPDDAPLHERAQVVGHRQRCGRQGLGVPAGEQPCNLERVERVALRRRGELDERRSREGDAEAVGDDALQRRDRQGAGLEAAQLPIVEGREEVRPLRLSSQRYEDADPVIAR